MTEKEKEYYPVEVIPPGEKRKKKKEGGSGKKRRPAPKERKAEKKERELFLFIPIGYPASGKSTFREFVLGTGWSTGAPVSVISRDDIRFKILESKKTGVYFDPKREREVTERHDEAFGRALEKEVSIFLDMTNLIPKFREVYIEPARRKGYKICFIDFRIPIGIASRRDRSRSRSVGPAVMKMMRERRVDILPREFALADLILTVRPSPEEYLGEEGEEEFAPTEQPTSFPITPEMLEEAYRTGKMKVGDEPIELEGSYTVSFRAKLYGAGKGPRKKIKRKKKK